MFTQYADLINDTYACENDRTMNQLLKFELGFRGYVMSDWGAQEGTLDAIAGLDVRICVLVFKNSMIDDSVSDGHGWRHLSGLTYGLVGF